MLPRRDISEPENQGNNLWPLMKTKHFLLWEGLLRQEELFKHTLQRQYRQVAKKLRFSSDTGWTEPQLQHSLACCLGSQLSLSNSQPPHLRTPVSEVSTPHKADIKVTYKLFLTFSLLPLPPLGQHAPSGRTISQGPNLWHVLSTKVMRV